MARAFPPSRVSYTEASFAVTGASRSSASVSWLAGDVLAFIGASENNDTIAVPTAPGLTFVSVSVNTTSATCGTRAAIATAASSSSSAISATSSSSVSNWGFGVWVFRGSDGLGSNGSQHTNIHTVSVVPTDTHSAWLIGVFDFSAPVPGGNTLTPTVTNLVESAQETPTSYTATIGDIIDQASASSTPYGFSAGGTTGDLSIVAVEVLGSNTATAVGNRMRRFL